MNINVERLSLKSHSPRAGMPPAPQLHVQANGERHVISLELPAIMDLMEMSDQLKDMSSTFSRPPAPPPAPKPPPPPPVNPLA